MDWEKLTMPCGEVAEGEFWAYLAVVESARPGLVLTRVRKGLLGHSGVPLPLVAAGDAARNAIAFPMGRGPGRPGGEPEMAALIESAKVYAERYEAGEDLGDYPAWRHGPARVPELPGEYLHFGNLDNED